MAETLDGIRERKGFYVHYYRIMVGALRIFLIMILLLVFGIVVEKQTHSIAILFGIVDSSEPTAYATSSDGMLEPLKTSTQPLYPLQK